MKKYDLPVLLGLNPPTKECVLIKTEKPIKGYALMIFHAEWPDGVEPGKQTEEKCKRGKLACWLQFVNLESMKNMGQNLVEFAEKMEEES